MFETNDKNKRNRRFSGFGEGITDHNAVASLASSSQQQRHPQQLAASFSPKVPPPVSGINTRTSGQNFSVPFFSMILDRTSFDEADDFRVNQEEIQNKLLPPSTRNLKRNSDGDTSNKSNFFQSSPPTIMANGKVRRRLKWRPRSPKKNKIPPPSNSQRDSFALNRYVSSQKHEDSSLRPNPVTIQEQGQQIPSSNTTSVQQYERQNLSEQQQAPIPQLSQRGRQQNRIREDRRAAIAINSPTGTFGNSYRFSRTTSKDYNNSCGGSVRSRRSVHSFASTETAAVSNKKRDKVSRYTPPLSSTIIEYSRPIRSSSFWTNKAKSPEVNNDDANKEPKETSDTNQINESDAEDSRCTSIFSVPLSVEAIESIESEDRNPHSSSNSVDKADSGESLEINCKKGNNDVTREADCNTEADADDNDDEEDDEFVELDTIETDSMSVSEAMTRSEKTFPSLFTASSSSSSLRSTSVTSLRSDTSSRRRRRANFRVPFSSRFGRRHSNHDTSQTPSTEIICYTPKALTTSVSFPGLTTVSSPVFSISKKAKTNILFRRNSNTTEDHNDEIASFYSAPVRTKYSKTDVTAADQNQSIFSSVGEEIESDRRVDLRIVRSDSNWSNPSLREVDFSKELIPTTSIQTKICKNVSSCTDKQLIHELRSCSFVDATSNQSRDTPSSSLSVSKIDRTNESNDDTASHTNDGQSIQSNHNSGKLSSEAIQEEADEDIEILRVPSQTSLFHLLPIPFKSVVSELFTTSKESTNSHSVVPAPRRCSSFSEQGSVPMMQSLPNRRKQNQIEVGEPFYELRFSMSKLTMNNDASVSTLTSAQEVEQQRQDDEESASDISVVAGTQVDDSRDNNLSTIQSPSPSLPSADDVDLAFLEAEKNLHAIEEVAMEHLQQGEYTEALDTFQEILRGLLTRYGERHFRVGTAVHNIGVVHMRRGDYTKAQVAYKEAVRVRKLVLDPYHPDVAVSLAQLGMAYLETNRHQAAIGAFRESLKIRRKCFGNYHPKVAKVLNNIGCALYELDELDVARVAFEEALDIQRRVLQQHSKLQQNDTDQEPSYETNDNAKIAALLSIASTQSNIASIKLYHGEFDAAAVDLEEALMLQQSLLGEHHLLVRRTKESLIWLEHHRKQQQQQTISSRSHDNTHHTTNNSNDNTNNGIDQHIRVQDILSQIGPPSAGTITPTSQPITNVRSSSNYDGVTYPSTTSLTSPFDNTKNSVLGSLERGLRMFHADLDYMSCAKME